MYRGLVIDDEEQARQLISRALGMKGIQCDTARDGVMASNMLESRHYDVVVTDLRMPRKHGFAVVEEILARDPHPLVFVVTGVQEPKMCAELISRGVVDVALKPISYEFLAFKVRAWLDREKAREGGRGGRQERKALANKLGATTSALKSELSAITSEFEKTISNLEKQRQDLEEGYLGAVRLLHSLIGQSVQMQSSHAGRVELMAGSIAEKIGLDRKAIREIKIAALLHEIGQFGMPNDVKSRPYKSLSPEARVVFEKYPLIGAALLSEVRGAAEVAEYIESHAENYDGTGFPRHKSGEEIPLGGRIIRLADGCDTMIMQRTASEKRDLGAITSHLKSQRGRAYDPELIEPALAYLHGAFKAQEDRKVKMLSVAALSSGMIVAENVYDAEGNFLLREGAEITPTILSRLRELLGPDVAIRVYSGEGD